MQDMTSIQSYLEGYINFIKGHSSEVKVADNAVKITLPFLDNLNDCTEIYIIKENENEFIVTDNGGTLTNLEFMGVTLKGAYKEAIFNRITNSYGVLRSEDSLYVKATVVDLYLKKHMLLQCIAKINDMYMLNRDNVQNIFLEEVKDYLDKSDIGYIPNHRLTGVSGLIANYDFAIPKRKKLPFTLIKTLNSLTINSVKSTVFDWNDTKDAFGEIARLLVIYNDEHNLPKDDSLVALQSYGINELPWSRKSELRKQLVG